MKIFIIAIFLLLNACVKTDKFSLDSFNKNIFENEGNKEKAVGLNLDENLKQEKENNEVLDLEYSNLDASIIISEFNPGINKKDDSIFPELRRFESKRFAVKLKNELENTNRVGAVRVMPDTSASGEIFIKGKILESNGEKVKVNIKMIDTSGKKLMDKKFSKKINEGHYSNSRTKNTDAYNEFFKEISLKIIEKLETLDADYIKKLTYINNLRFSSEFAPESFKSYLKSKNNKYEVIAMPSDDDPMWKRVNSIKVREQLFVDSLQSHYSKFVNFSNESYFLWQSQSFNEIKAAKLARNKAIGRGILGVLSIAAAVASATNKSSDDYNYSNEIGLTTLSGKLIEDALKYKAEAKMHRDSVVEIGNSIDTEIAPNIIEFENKTVELTGSAKQQYLEWRKFLKEIYELERTPNLKI